MSSLDSDNPPHTVPRGSTFDLALLTLSALSSLVFLFFLLSPQHEIATTLHSAGTLQLSSNVVKIRQDQDWAWFEGQVGDKIHFGDLIFTHENSQASVDLDWGQKIKLNSNTLIKIARNEARNISEIEIQKGHILATMPQTEAGKQELGLKFKGKSYLLHSSGKGKAKVQFKAEKGSGQLFVLEGSTELKTGQGNFTISSAQKINITNEGPATVEKMKVVPMAPVDDKTIALDLSDGHHSFVKLQWQSEEASFDLKIARDPELSQLVYSGPVQGLEYLFIPDSEGSFFWKITPKNETSSGPVLSFNVFAEQAPEISLDPPGPDYVLDETVLYSFQNLAQNLKIQYHLAVDSQDRHENLSSPDGVFNYTFSQPGTYIFKGWKEFKGHLSKEKSATVLVQDFKLSVAPELTTPQDGQVDLYIQEKSGPKVPHSVIVSLERYERRHGVEVSLFSLKDKQERMLRSDDELTIIKLSAFGKYQLKARSYLKTHPDILSPWSKTISYEMKALERPNALPENGTRIELEKPSEKVTFSWDASPSEELLSAKYLFEIDDNPDFSSPSRQVVLENTTRFTDSIDRPGIYYWRTKIITTSGEVLYSRPKKVEISPIPPPPAIELQDLKLKIKFKQTHAPTFFQKLIQLFLSNALAETDEGQGYVEISWPQSKNAEYYQLQIFKNPNDKTAIIEKKLKEIK